MLRDTQGRSFRYLRLSVTDYCNFRCTYCLPDGYQKSCDSPPPLTIAEIKNLFHACGHLGFEKIRLTGGEPTTRRDIVDIVAAAADAGSFEKIAMTTNGYRLKSLLHPLKNAGLSHLNVSIDSLDQERFTALTGRDLLLPIKQGVEDAIVQGFAKVKVNAVLMTESFEHDLELFLKWIEKVPVVVRFIELMETVGRRDFFRTHHVRAGHLIAKLVEAGFAPRERSATDGPAVEYQHPQFAGSIGIIAPYSKDFCNACNRLRVTSQGELRLCLFGNQNYSLRPLLQEVGQRDELCARMTRLVHGKADGHLLHEGDAGNNKTLSAMGG